MLLPVPGVEVLGLGSKGSNGPWVTREHQATLDVWYELLVILRIQGPLVKHCKDGILVEINIIPHNMMVVPH